MALLLVLSLLLLLAAAAFLVTAVSQVTAYETKVSVTRSRQRYAAESAASEILRKLMADRRQYPDRRVEGILIGTVLPGRDAAQTSGSERWLADGQSHRLAITADGDDVMVVTEDGNSGVSAAGPNLATELGALIPGDADDASAMAARQRRLERFMDALQDAADADQAKRINGHEQPDYAAAGWPDLPRNGAPQYADELFWVAGFADLWKAEGETEPADPARLREFLRILPPRGIPTARPPRPQFAGSSPEMASALLGLKPAENKLLREAMARWRRDGTPLSESLAPDLIQRLREKFSFQESGIVTLRITIHNPARGIQTRLICTRDLNAGARMAGTMPYLVWWQSGW